jgi:NAD(P)-dependent dehydrogenase (short-subunit alcohol dehydrogenase family)
MTPLARFGATSEVSGAAVFLVSDEASFITGQTLSINGGAFMS